MNSTVNRGAAGESRCSGESPGWLSRVGQPFGKVGGVGQAVGWRSPPEMEAGRRVFKGFAAQGQPAAAGAIAVMTAIEWAHSTCA